ncbi:MAG: TonB-dependent receptor [Candidatus Acidiferrum sp.]
MTVRVFVLAVAILLSLAGHRTMGQATSGVTGVVTDQSGASISGVQVTLTNPQKGFEARTTTNDEGIYQFRLVPPGGGYQLTFTKDSFNTLTLDKLALGVSVTETKDVHLVVGSAQQRIEVTVQGEGSLNTTDASIGQVIETRQVQDLPIQIRTNAAGLLALQPGVQADSSAAGDQYGSVTGARADQQNITVDGLDVTDETIGQAFTTVGRAPVDSIQEVRVIVGNSDSTFGRSSSAQVDLVTKSGSNEFHGSLSEYNRNTDLTANTFFNNVNGVPRAPLVRNQYGGNVGGPIKKDKLFFFFDYVGLKQNANAHTIQDVPVAAVRAGGLNYINSNPGCTSSARLNTDPSCITTLTASQVATLDPQGIGADPALLALFNSRYPLPNDPSAGDGVNTEGYLFNAPELLRENTFVGRVDFNLTSKQTIFARGTWDRDNNTETSQQFPGDPTDLIGEINHNRSFVVGYTYQLSPNLLNNVYAGLTRQLLSFPADFAPSFPNSFGFGQNTDLTAPYGSFSSQARNVAVPEVREQLSWSKGRHYMVFGIDMKFIREFSQLNNSFNFPTIGMGGLINELSPNLRPADINQDQVSINEYDGFFPLLLGRFASTSANYNYDVAGNPLPVGSPANRNYVYNEYEPFAQDTFKIRKDLTITAGLRWQYHAVPYEQNGFESIANIDANNLFTARYDAALAGNEGNTAAPLVSYILAGSKNGGPGYYHPDYKDFAPKLGIAYSPSFTDGLLGALFGDHKTVVRAGGSIVYDRILNTLEFELDEENFLFSNSVPQEFGTGGDPTTSLATDPRFTGIASSPVVTASPIPRPYTPNVDGSGNPIGLAGLGGFPNFFSFNQNLKTPYAITASFGVQRELPGNVILEVDYFGRFGRRLAAIGDAAQTVNFKDAASGQFLYNAFANVQKQVQSGVAPGAVTAQPWFEDQLSGQLANYGLTCPATGPLFGLPSGNCTQLAAQLASSYFPVGDVSSAILTLAETGVLPPNSGLDAQTGSAGYIGNYGNSSYNSLLVTIRKKFSHNLTADFNYAFAHSIDNVSDINNSFVDFTSSGEGLICDLRNLHVCRASSDFDARHTFNANYIYTLPIGTGQRFLGGASKALNELVGGWGVSSIITWHSGYPFSANSNTFPIDFTMSAPAAFDGNAQAIKPGIHTENGQVQFFADPTAANNAFSYPFGGGTGSRNALRGPNYSDVDMGLFKNFAMPWSDKQRLQFRADAFNVFNNVSFATPGNGFNTGGFGVLTSQENSPRVLQLSLRFDF